MDSISDSHPVPGCLQRQHFAQPVALDDCRDAPGKDRAGNVRFRKKGERIVVIHTLPAAKVTTVLEKLAQCDLPVLWRPKSHRSVHVDSIPALCTGKMDPRAIRVLATSLAAEVEAEAQA
jgi:hypothetical protein